MLDIEFAGLKKDLQTLKEISKTLSESQKETPLEMEIRVKTEQVIKCMNKINDCEVTKKMTLVEAKEYVTKTKNSCNDVEFGAENSTIESK